MAVDREALKQRLEHEAATAQLDGCAIPREWLSQEELRSLLAEREAVERERAALQQHARSVSDSLLDERDQLRERVDDLGYRLEATRNLTDAAVTYGEKVEAERDRLKDALSHAYADARALWSVERDQLEAELASVTSINGALQDEAAQLRAVLQAIINSAPDREPERYDGESHERIRDNAMDSEAYWLAQIARRASGKDE